jgi:ATP-binding cassette, subfamily B, bacterial
MVETPYHGLIMRQNYYDQAKRRAKSKDLRPLTRLLPYLFRYKTKIACAIAALVVAACATLVVPLAVRRLIDDGFSAANAELINRYFLLMLAVVVVLAVSSALRFYFVSWLGERVVADVRDAVFRHLMTLTPSFYEQQKTGEITSRLTADTTAIKAAFSWTASVALRNMVTLTGAAAMMIYTAPKLAALATLAIPVIVIPLVWYGKQVRSLARQAQDALAASAAFAQEHLGAITTVQSNTQEKAARDYFEGATLDAFNAARKRTVARGMLTAAIIFVSMGAIVLLLWLGSKAVLNGEMTGGVLSQFVIYAVMAASSVGQISEVWGEFQTAAGAAERISELLDETPAISSTAGAALMPMPVRGEVRFDDVSFRYPSRPEATVLKSINIVARPGEVTAIVGPSGAGKSTIFNLAQRFHDPILGVVRLDGVDISSVELENLRQQISAVPQDPVIFSGTVRQNILFSRPDASEVDMLAAAKAARVDEFVQKLPQTYDTLLGERGVTLSGGQRQRVAIARAILRNAPVLLLDEATSSLDAESEALIQEALEAASRNRTTLVIAHRLATVRNAQKIIVLEEGHIVAEGTHGELMQKSPLYEKLARLQFTVPSV